jgi:two-component system, OmpR family, response regulator
MRVLLVEDETRLSATLARGLKAEGFVVVTVGTGVEVLRRIRAKKVWTPVLMLTAQGREYEQTDAAR